jgi:type I restriction enzyme M protein
LTHIEQNFDGALRSETILGWASHGNQKRKNELIIKVLVHLDEIDFDLENTDSDVLGDAYEYLMGQVASGAGRKQVNFIPTSK